MKVTYQYSDRHLSNSEPLKFSPDDLKSEEMIFNLGPQHPSTHGVLRLEVLTDGEIVKDVVPHIGYLHRCFEKHAEKLPFNQTLPFTDRMDYVAAINNEWAFAMGVERMMGIDKDLPKRVEYIRVLVAELNRLASHFVAIGTYGMDIGAFTPFLWLMRDRETILRMLEWTSGARMLYNYIWVGGLYYDIPVGFEAQCARFCEYIKPKLKAVDDLLISNKIFIERTANVGVLDKHLAINYGVTGPNLRASGLRFDLRKVDAYSVYPELTFDVPVGKGEMGTVGDCWDRIWVRQQECYESIRLIEQCVDKLQGAHARTKDFDPRAMVPKKIRPNKQDFYVRAENPKGELGFFFRTDGRSDIPFRCKSRGPSFSNLSVLPEISKGVMLADLFAIVGSLDLVMGEVDR
jgi:NADH-quinone oxidoreductase subunit D